MNHFLLPFEKQADGGKPHDPDHFDPEIYKDLNLYEAYHLSFHPERPKFLDYLKLFHNVSECFWDDRHGSCLLPTFRAEFHAGDRSIPVMLIGMQSGPTSKYSELLNHMRDAESLRKWNHGMQTPASYERAAKAIRTAGEEDRLVITWIDTPGADPTEESEEGGIAWRIGECIQELAECTVPTLSVIMNRGCSGGAIALTGCDRVLAMQNATYLVISPEACSSILFRTRERSEEAAESMKITAEWGKKFGIIDEIIPEEPGPAHRFRDEAMEALRQNFERVLPELSDLPREDVFARRVEKWNGWGHWEEAGIDVLHEIQKPVTNLPKANQTGFVKRHDKCVDAAGNHHYDPEYFEALANRGFVCGTCGKRYARPTAWDYIDAVLDEGSWREHQETALLLDKDILHFPGYAERLIEDRKKTGQLAAMMTGDGTIEEIPVVFGTVSFQFLGGTLCNTTAEKIWRATEISLRDRKPMVLIATGGGARMHEGCPSMVGIPKIHVALSRLEHAGLPLIVLVTDPTVGGVSISYASRGHRMVEEHAGNIGFSGRRVIEQYTRHKTPRDFQTAKWLKRQGHFQHLVRYPMLRHEIGRVLRHMMKSREKVEV